MPTTRRPSGSKPEVIIIGGGASGLAAACVLADAGVPALVLEKEEKAGRKLLATGNGRCNLLNFGPPVFFGDAAFARQALSHCGAAEVAAFFAGLGLGLREEEGGRAYPLPNQAAAVADSLLARLQESPGVKIRTGARVTDVRRAEGGFLVETADGGRFSAPRLIAAPGSPAAPRLGGSGELLGVLARLGHGLVPPRPALCPLETETAAIRGLSGLRAPAWLTLFIGGEPACAAAGEALFTDYGVSGVCAMQLARDAGRGLQDGREVILSVDFSPLCGLAPPLMRRLSPSELRAGPARREMQGLLEARFARLGPGRAYTGLLPRALANKVRGLPLPEAAEWLSGLRLRVTGVKGFDQAQVAAGGLSCAGFDPETFQSRSVPGLYVTGEALNVDGDTGGFNLLFAWAGGILAGRHAAGEAERPS